MNDDSFFSLYMRGEVSRFLVDDYIDKWHSGFSSQTLHDFLGMTWEEYTHWFAPGSKVLERDMETRAWKDVQAERHRQDMKWGGPEHDDTHSIYDWGNYICQRSFPLYQLPASEYSPRRLLVEIAALALAAIESLDRLRGEPDDRPDAGTASS